MLLDKLEDTEPEKKRWRIGYSWWHGKGYNYYKNVIWLSDTDCVISIINAFGFISVVCQWHSHHSAVTARLHMYVFFRLFLYINSHFWSNVYKWGLRCLGCKEKLKRWWKQWQVFILRCNWSVDIRFQNGKNKRFSPLDSIFFCVFSGLSALS